MTALLIVRLGALGDVVHAMPVAAVLRERYPQARIDWLVDPRYLDVVKMVDGVTTAIPFDPRGLMAAGRRAAAVETIARLRRARYDAVFDLQGLIKSAVVARLARGRETIGFTPAHLREPAARFFYTHRVDVPADVHVIRKNLALVSSVEPPRFVLNVPASPVADAVAAAYGPPGFVAMNPGAGWPNKQWPASRFGQTAGVLRERYGLRTLALWGAGEEALARELVAASGGAADLAPATSILDLFSVLGRARLVIAGDTGPLHIAGAVGAPLVALFGPTDPRRNGPWHDRDLSVSRHAACVCHYERRCRRAAPCIDDVAVEEVVAAAATRLASSSEARA